MADPDLFRAMEYVGTITPIQAIRGRPTVAQSIATAFAATAESPPVLLPGPDREQLLAIVS